MLDAFKLKMKGSTKKTISCEWIRTDPVEGEKCLAESEEEFIKPQNLLNMLIYRVNLLLQRTGIELSSKLSSGIHPLDAWNDT